MPLTDADVDKIVAKLKPLIPTAAQIAVAVLDSPASDVIPVADARKLLRPVSALADIHKAVAAIEKAVR